MTAKTWKWTEEAETQLVDMIGTNTDVEVSADQIEAARTMLGNSARSVASKLRNMGYQVASMAKSRVAAFTDDEAAELSTFVEDNSGNLTYGEIAESFAGGKFTAKQVQGKILSMELTHHVRPTEKVVAESTYSPEDQNYIIEAVGNGDFVEVIAATLGREVKSVRGKCLSLLQKGLIESMPTQRDKASKSTTDLFEGLTLAEMTVEEIAASIGKTERGVKTMLTRRGLTAKDYDGAAKKAKAEGRRNQEESE